MAGVLISKSIILNQLLDTAFKILSFKSSKFERKYINVFLLDFGKVLLTCFVCVLFLLQSVSCRLGVCGGRQHRLRSLALNQGRQEECRLEM